MEGASLFGAFCKDAKFVGARLNNADLESVDFENADLSEAVLEGAQVRATQYSEGQTRVVCIHVSFMSLENMPDFELVSCRSPMLNSRTSTLWAVTVSCILPSLDCCMQVLSCFYAGMHIGEDACMQVMANGGLSVQGLMWFCDEMCSSNCAR